MGSKKKSKRSDSDKTQAETATSGEGVVNAELASESNEASTEAGKTSTPRSNRRAVQQLADGIGQLATTLTGAGIVMWSVFNLSWNFLAYRADETDANNWGIAFVMVLLTTLVPLLFGFWLLFGSMSKKKPN